MIALIFNSFLWYTYRNKSEKEIREKEGWNSFYLRSNLLIIILLLMRIGKI